MAYKVQQLAKEPIIVSTWLHPMDPLQDLQGITKEVTQFVEQIKGPVYYISDTTAMDAIGFSEMVVGLAQSTRGGIFTIERLHTIIVGSAEAIEFVVQSLQQDQYGNINIPLYSSLDEAITYARGCLAS